MPIVFWRPQQKMVSPLPMHLLGAHMYADQKLANFYPGRIIIRACAGVLAAAWTELVLSAPAEEPD